MTDTKKTNNSSTPLTLVINSGSSSLKFAVFSHCQQSKKPTEEFRASIDDIASVPHLHVHGNDHCELGNRVGSQENPVSCSTIEEAHAYALDWINEYLSPGQLTQIAYRVVHGGDFFSTPTEIDDSVIERIRSLVPFAPLHQPMALDAIHQFMQAFPKARHIACFDTAFHRTMPETAQRFAIPDVIHQQGVKPYGFHGLSYQYIIERLGELRLGRLPQRVIIAHLGNGASVCAVRDGKSIATSMSFSPLDGLPMATRCGALDAGAVLYMVDQLKYSTTEVLGMLNGQSGLLALSGSSGDVRILMETDTEAARFALDYYVSRIAQTIGSMMVQLGGIDSLVFTGGVGKHIPGIRQRICDQVAWMGVTLDHELNERNEYFISSSASRVSVFSLKTDEELMMARLISNGYDRNELIDHDKNESASSIASLDHDQLSASSSPNRSGSASVSNGHLSDQELYLLDAYWRACNYLAVGMIYLQDNPLLHEPLREQHIKQRLLGHWGSSPGLSFMYVHMTRLIKKHDLNAIFLAGPGHGAPGVIAPVYLEGTYSEVYPDVGQDLSGMQRLFKRFSFPGGIGSHCTPELPGSIHEGGELGYSISHAFGAAFDNPDLIVTVAVGDGEAETGPLATSWHSNKFLNPVRDGAVLPILHLNGYKINNPTLLSRISHAELEALFKGYGWIPHFVEGDDPMLMHQKMAITMEQCLRDIRDIQYKARHNGQAQRAFWPMIVLRSPKGWTGPKDRKGYKLEGSWRAHQVPLKNVHDDAEELEQLQQWLSSYKPEELFDENGALVEELKQWAPDGELRMSANPHANGGLIKRNLRMPDFRDYAVEVAQPAQTQAMNTRPLGELLRDIMRDNNDNFRVFGPDENTSNKLDALYEVSKKLWLADYYPEDANGGELDPEGRVLEMLSEHTLEGWLEGYVLSGRHGFFATYESFVHVIDSMFNQHAKWLTIAEDLSWRAPIASINLLITSTVWRQDHNGFTHQDPGFLDLVVNKKPEVTRIYLPPDVNCLLSTADHCLRSQNDINVIVCDKQMHMQYLDMDSAIKHCTKGLGIWEWASNDDNVEPDVVMVGCGDIPTKEALAATALLRDAFPELKLRFINVVDLFRMTPESEHPHGLSDSDFDSLFTTDKPIIFNFHGYPWLIHRLAYRRTNHENLHVRGYKERGNINTPLELAMDNHIDRFSLAIDVINRVPGLSVSGAHAKEHFQDRKIECQQYAHQHGVDMPEIVDWVWPF